MRLYLPRTHIANRYEVTRVITTGGMGIVYLCVDTHDRRPVALKTFKPEYLPDREARDRFLREGTAWVNLGQHPHIVRAYDVRRLGDGREVFLVLEQIIQEPGRKDAALRSWLIPGKPLPVAEALLIALQIVRGLQHASETMPGFVHRDLKPENVLVGADHLPGWPLNRVRVTDFGLATLAQGLTLPESAASADVRKVQPTHNAVGTPLYMAPEQWRGEPVSAQTDMYALGLVLFEMLTGEYAVPGRTPKDLAWAHTAGQLTPWRGRAPHNVQQIVARCVAQRPTNRYGDWAALELALCETYRNLSGQNAPPPATARALAQNERAAHGWAQSALGVSYMDLGKIQVAQNYFERARQIGVAERDPLLEAAGLSHLGNVYVTLGDFPNAITCYQQALALDRATGNQPGESMALSGLGLAYKGQNDLRRAMVCYEQGLAIDRAIGNLRGVGNGLGNLGNAYLRLGDLQRALEYYEQSLATHRDLGDFRGEGDDLGNLGSAYLEAGDAQRAHEYFSQALSIHQALGNLHGVALNAFNLALLYQAQGAVAQALRFAQEAAHAFAQIGHPAYAQRAQQLVAQLRRQG